MKYVYWVYQVFFYFILALVLALGIINLAPQMFGIKPYVVLSGSMEPEIQTGAVVFINRRAKDIRVNDVIAYARNETVVTHRVVETTAMTVRCKGDANEEADAKPVEKSDILGRAIGSLPYLGYAYEAVWRPSSFFIVALLVFLDACLSHIATRKPDK